MSTAARWLAGGSFWPIVVLNLVPVAGVIFLGWGVWAILVVYWLENAVAGAFAFLRIGLAEGVPDPASDDPFSKPGVAPQGLQFFLVLHFGIFWLATSQLAFGWVPAILGPSAEPLPPWPLLLLAVVPLGVARWREYRRFIDRGDYRRATPASQMWAPYPRVAVLQGAILGSAFVGSLLPAAVGSVTVICIKAAFEVMVELRLGPFGTLADLIDPPAKGGPHASR